MVPIHGDSTPKVVEIPNNGHFELMRNTMKQNLWCNSDGFAVVYGIVLLLVASIAGGVTDYDLSERSYILD
jgi:hypothetical protein